LCGAVSIVVGGPETLFLEYEPVWVPYKVVGLVVPVFLMGGAVFALVSKPGETKK